MLATLYMIKHGLKLSLIGRSVAGANYCTGTYLIVLLSGTGCIGK